MTPKEILQEVQFLYKQARLGIEWAMSKRFDVSRDIFSEKAKAYHNVLQMLDPEEYGEYEREE